MSKVLGAFMLDDEEEDDDDAYATSYDEGYDAYWDGEPRSSCGTSEARSGWDDAQEEDDD